MNRRIFLLMVPVVMMGAVLPVAFSRQVRVVIDWDRGVAWIVGERVLKMSATPHAIRTEDFSSFI